MFRNFFAALALAIPAGAQAFDHGGFDALLRAHVRDGRVDYAAFAGSRAFAGYRERLAAADPAGLADRERLAFWINAYNAWTIELIVAHDERRSIRNLDEPWKQRRFRSSGRLYSLDQVEHEVIRREWREPRIHFALVCAAVGCPPLRAEAYTGAKLEAQLEDQARRFFIASPASNRVDVASGTLHLSPLLDWYADDFGGRSALPGYLARYWPAGHERELLLSGRAKIAFTEYDWTLNKIPGGAW
jgi:hypothetical protein